MNYNLYSGWTCACNRTLKGASRLIDSLQRQPQILLLNIFLVLICLLDCSSYGWTRLFQKVTNSEFRKDFYGNGKLQKWILGHLFFPWRQQPGQHWAKYRLFRIVTLTIRLWLERNQGNQIFMSDRDVRGSAIFIFSCLFLIGHPFPSLTSISKPRGQRINSPQ